MYVMLRGCWCDIIILNARLSTLNFSADLFLKHHMKIQLGDFNRNRGGRIFSSPEFTWN